MGRDESTDVVDVWEGILAESGDREQGVESGELSALRVLRGKK